MSSVGTRESLLSIIDDIELIAKELFENLIAPKGQKLTSSELNQLAELLVLKDQELKSTLSIAAEQAEIQKKIDSLQAEVEKQDQDINHLQKYLKEAEHMLATAVYQARQKLQCIAKSNEKSVSVDDLIKYTHRISCSYAVAAPHNWQPGDPRRPYPTDIEMRLGFLGRLSDLPMSGASLQQGNLDMSVSRGTHGVPLRLPDIEVLLYYQGGRRPGKPGNLRGHLNWEISGKLAKCHVNQGIFCRLNGLILRNNFWLRPLSSAEISIGVFIKKIISTK